MCVIVYVPSDIKVTRERMENCFDSNPHGAGFMYQDKKHNQIIIKKGYMNFADFWAEFSRLPWNVDRVAHFRIATSGKIDAGCCHPFPLTSDYKEMRRAKSQPKVGVAHNGVIHWTEPKDKMKSNYSDSMAFVANYLNYMKPVLFSQEFGDIVDHATNGKFAIMDATRVSLIGDWQISDGVFYSNDSYEDIYTKYNNYSYKYLDSKFLNDLDDESWETGKVDVGNPGFYRIGVACKNANWKTADFLCKKFEEAGSYVEDYWLAQDMIVYTLDCLPIDKSFYGFEWVEFAIDEVEMSDQELDEYAKQNK